MRHIRQKEVWINSGWTFSQHTHISAIKEPDLVLCSSIDIKMTHKRFYIMTVVCFMYYLYKYKTLIFINVKRAIYADIYALLKGVKVLSSMTTN